MDLEKKYEEGCYLIDRKNYVEALKAFTEVLKEDSQSYPTLNKIGVTYVKMGEKEKAREYFLKALEINESYGPSLVNMGNIQSENGNRDGAIEYYEEAVKKDPEYYLAYYNLAAIHKANGNYEEYVKNIKKYKKSYKSYINNKELNDASKTNRSKIYLTAMGIAVVITFVIFIFN